ncbi:hypothetical protein H5410_029123 [Solanum commersonii]|uniref:RRM domain-containing protein n=1 Tax=Solanum commersonii TaxID=4109 RepID=A0A9J5Z6V6_SOLCO|nr:hypothetical protein H5410_029123 [Solanum commersonii]
MAFCNKLGGLLRQSISCGNAVSANSPTPAMLNAIRCMSSRLFVGGLSWGTDDQSLKEAFTSFGDVVDGKFATKAVKCFRLSLFVAQAVNVLPLFLSKVIIDRDSGRSRGFGFVNFSDEDCAKEAMNAMDGQQLHGRNIRVNLAQERAPRSGGYGGGGGGGYGGGYGGQARDNDGF